MPLIKIKTHSAPIIKSVALYTYLDLYINSLDNTINKNPIIIVNLLGIYITDKYDIFLTTSILLLICGTASDNNRILQVNKTIKTILI